MLGIKGKLDILEERVKESSLIKHDPYQAPSQQDGVRSPGAKPYHTQTCVQRLRPSSACTTMLSEDLRGTLALSTPSCYLQSFADAYNYSNSLPFPSSPVEYYAYGHYQIQLLWKMRKKLKFS